jgi:hypothetical protein
MNRVESLFKDRAILKGGMMFLPRDVAIQFVHECKNLGLKILGIDGFYLFGDAVQPSLDHSIDFSIINETTNYDKAEQFIMIGPDNVFFEITTDD